MKITQPSGGRLSTEIARSYAGAWRAQGYTAERSGETAKQSRASA